VTISVGVGMIASGIFRRADGVGDAQIDRSRTDHIVIALR
jgi:hypothetical protein